MADNDWQSSMAQLTNAITVAGASIASITTDKLKRGEQKDALKWNQDMTERQQDFAESQWEWNKQTTEENNAFNKQMALDSFNFNKDYQLNKYQYTVQDAQKAGLNPLALGGMNAGSAQVSGGNADVSGASGSSGAGVPGNDNPFMSSLGSILGSVIANQGSARVARIESDAQKEIARIQASSNRQIAEMQARSNEDISSRNNQNALYLQGIKNSHDLSVRLREIASREKISSNEIKNGTALQRMRLNQEDRQFILTHVRKAFESDREFAHSEKYRDLEYKLSEAKTAADVKKAMHDIKIDWSEFGSSNARSIADMILNALFPWY